MPASPPIDIEPMVRMILAGLSGVDSTLAAPALHAALCELTRAQYAGDNTSAALTIIENTLAFYRTHQRPMPGLTLSDTPARKDVN